MALNVGDLHRVVGTFKNAADVPTNPTTTKFRLIAPDGTVTEPTPVNDSAGVFHYDVPITQVGRYQYAWVGTGAVVAAEPGDFYVSRAPAITEPITP